MILCATLLFAVGLFIAIIAGVWAAYWSTGSGLNAKFDAIHRELGEVSGQLVSIEAQLTIIEAQLTIIEAQLTIIEADLTATRNGI